MEVGGKKILMNETIFVPDDESATFVCPVDGSDELPVRLEFIMEHSDESTPEEKRPAARFAVEYESPTDTTKIDCLVLRFFNFDKALGQSLTAPVKVAINEEKEIVLFYANVHKLARMRKVEFQFMLMRAVA